jgi:shikimate dehydrogenase
MTSIDQYAVFGQPIKHSKSPRIHQLFAAQTGQSLHYFAKEVSASEFSQAVDDFFAQGGKGLNCTLPLKELAWLYANIKTERAQLSKAVNTLYLQENGVVIGDNTDGCGLIRDLMANHHIPLASKNILLLGAGGASRGIIGPLLEQSPQQLTVANRTINKAVDLATEFQHKGSIFGCGFDDLIGQQYDLILNATSTSLNGELPPLTQGLLTTGAICYDLAYGNQPTAFVRWGTENQAYKNLDGLGMLVEQAAEAFFIWRGVRPNTPPVIALLNSERAI